MYLSHFYQHEYTTTVDLMKLLRKNVEQQRRQLDKKHIQNIVNNNLLVFNVLKV